MANKRLFLFAGFDRDNIVDDTLIYYIQALSKLGDIIFVMYVIESNLSIGAIAFVITEAPNLDKSIAIPKTTNIIIKPIISDIINSFMNQTTNEAGQ